jgi:hypothetical protein
MHIQEHRDLIEIALQLAESHTEYMHMCMRFRHLLLLAALASAHAAPIGPPTERRELHSQASVHHLFAVWAKSHGWEKKGSEIDSTNDAQPRHEELLLGTSREYRDEYMNAVTGLYDGPMNAVTVCCDGCLEEICFLYPSIEVLEQQINAGDRGIIRVNEIKPWCMKNVEGCSCCSDINICEPKFARCADAPTRASEEDALADWQWDWSRIPKLPEASSR